MVSDSWMVAGIAVVALFSALRDPLSSTSSGTCTCGTDWHAWDKETPSQRRGRLGL